jgi:MoaA/NifB/PqqE/SkfB family radical SAM enzyme
VIPYSALSSLPRVDLAQAVPLPAPFKVYVEPTNICNFKCTCCPESFEDYNEKSGGRFMMSPDDFSLIASELINIAPVKVLHFYMMGEPLANKNTPAFIKMAKQLKLADRLVLTTNASLLDERASKELIDAELDYLRISVYGIDQESFTRTTGNKMPIERIWENVIRFQKIRGNRTKPFTYAKMIEGNQDENKEFLSAWACIVDEVEIEPVMNWNCDFDGDLTGKNDHAVGAWFKHKKTCCPSPFFVLVIHSDLRVSVCCVDWNKQLVIGNLREQTLDEIWHGNKLRAIQIAHLEGRRHELPGCSSCTFLHSFPDNLDSLDPQAYKDRLSSLSRV